jgi:hypothetical protein
LGAAVTALPPKYRRRLMVTCDGAGASHGLIERLDALAARPGHQLVYSVGWDQGERERLAIAAVPGEAWQIAIDRRGTTSGARGTPGHPARQPGHCHTQTLNQDPLRGSGARLRPATDQPE